MVAQAFQVAANEPAERFDAPITAPASNKLMGVLRFEDPNLPGQVFGVVTGQAKQGTNTVMRTRALPTSQGWVRDWPDPLYATNYGTNYGTAIAVQQGFANGHFLTAAVGAVQTPSGFDTVVILYDQAGNYIWPGGARFYNHLDVFGNAAGDDIPVDVVIDNLGYVYVLVTSTGGLNPTGVNTNKDIALVKFGNGFGDNGDMIWEYRYNNGDVNLDDIAVDLDIFNPGFTPGAGECDATGVYVTGISYSVEKQDIITFGTRLSGPSGNAPPDVIFKKRYQGGRTDIPTAIKVREIGDPSDSIYTAVGVFVTGYTERLTSGWDYVTLAYSGCAVGLEPAGDEFWNAGNDLPLGERNFYDAGAGLTDIARGIEVVWEPLNQVNGPGPYVYVTGESNTTTNGFDFVTIKYNAVDGRIVDGWGTAPMAEPGVARFDRDPTSGDDKGLSIVAGEKNDLYVVGSSIGFLSVDYLTIRYDLDDGERNWVIPAEGFIAYDNAGSDLPAQVGLMRRFNNSMDPCYLYKPFIFVHGTSAAGTGTQYAVPKYEQLGPIGGGSCP
ncbi:MAG: hypothetical protein AB7G11_09535 [Phycisphaerales bacterium]